MWFCPGDGSVRDIIYKNPCCNSFAMIYMKYDCSLQMYSVILLQRNILASASNVFMQFLYKYYKFRNFRSVIPAALLTHCNLIAVFCYQWYCGLYQYISLIILLPKEPICTNILSTGVCNSDMQMILAKIKHILLQLWLCYVCMYFNNCIANKNTQQSDLIMVLCSG